MIEEYKGQLPDNMLEDCAKKFEELKLTKKQQEDVLKKLKHDFEAAKINPGEAIGIITAESFGEPGTQMCISYNEKVIFKFKNQVKIMKVGEFVDKVFDSVKYKKHGDYEFYVNKEDLKVLSLDKDEKLKWAKVFALNRHVAPEKLIKINTRSGRNIVATDFHSFVTRKNNKIVSIAGKDLKLGDRLPVMNYLPEKCIKSVTVGAYFNNLIIENGRLTKPGTQAKSIPNTLTLNELFGNFVGAYLSEGCSTSGQVSISNVDENFISNIRRFMGEIGLDYKEKWNDRGFALGRDLIISSSLLAQFISAICGKGSENKKVPDFAYSAEEEFVRGLIRSYFDGDGNVNVERRVIRASSNSEELIRGIALLLTRFKIFSRIAKDKKGQYWLHIPYSYSKLFLEKIGFDIVENKEKLKRLVKLSNNRDNESLDQIEMVSGFDNILRNLSRKLNYPTRYVNNFTNRQVIGKATLSRYVKLFQGLAERKKINIENELSILKTMLNSDIIWDEIVSIKYVKPESKYVYDLSVPKQHTFTTFNGIVTHNTLSVFHFAGVAEFAVTLGLPRLIEILDARKEMATPLIEVYVEKPDNKEPDKVKKIAGSIKETKLSEIVTEFAINLAKLQIELTPNKPAMKDFGITDAYLIDALQKELKGSAVKEAEGKYIVKTKAKENELLETYKLKEKLKEVYIKGVRGITSVLPVKKENEFVIVATGTNLKDVLLVKGVDATRTRANNPFEAAKILGIEAARQVIIDEIAKAFEDQGLDIDIRHAMFVADLMTATGEIKGITRSGITGEKESVLARASFETPIKHIVNASLIGEKDELNSVIENVILNQEIPLGTGLPDLVARMKTEEEKK